jgi:hypothetical protein
MLRERLLISCLRKQVETLRAENDHLCALFPMVIEDSASKRLMTRLCRSKQQGRVHKVYCEQDNANPSDQAAET